MGAGATRRRRLAATLLVLALSAGCSYADDEPGLFGRTPASEGDRDVVGELGKYRGYPRARRDDLDDR